MAGLTVKDFLDGKGKRQYSLIRVDNHDEAVAAEAAGIDMVGTAFNPTTRDFPSFAPNTHFRFGLKYGEFATAADAIKGAFEAMAHGAESVYCPMSIDVVREMAREGIPVIGHVGLVPSWRTWTGGFRAVGKTAEQAIKICDDVKRYEDAGAFGIEVEVIPDKVASEITKRTSMLTISVGAGSGCDMQFLFARDILGNNPGHMPRHAKAYRNFLAEKERLQQERISAFEEFRTDIESGGFPERKHLVDISDEQHELFMNGLKSWI